MDQPSPAGRPESLRGFGLFADLSPAELALVAAEVRPLSIPGGEYLCRQGDEADGLHLLVHGRLRVWVHDDDDESDRMVGEIAPGETVGEMALFTGERRSASVQAVRDSELLALPKAAFDRLLSQHPRSMLELARLIVRRNQRLLQHRTIRPTVKTIVVFPATRAIEALPLAWALTEVLSPLGVAELVDPGPAGFDPDQRAEWIRRIHDIESRRDFVVLACHAEVDAWTRFALSQADRILVVCDPAGEPRDAEGHREALARAFARREIVRVHPGRVQPSGTAAWCRAFATEDRHHVALGDPGSLRRLARLVTGRGIGVVLSGGGARAFAHVGLLEALESHGVSIDHVGGTSMGGIIAARYAMGSTPGELREWIREQWAGRRLRNDYTLPLYSVVVGRHYANIIRRSFGDLEMEDLWLNCFCVSANITKSCLRVHRSGLLRHAARATGALPGMLPPVHLDGDVLVDGGVLNNIPIDVMDDLDRGRIIASRVIPRRGFRGCLEPDQLVSGWSLFWKRLVPGLKPPPLPGIGDVMVRASFLSTIVNQNRICRQAEFLMDFDLTGYGTLEWDACEAIFRQSAEQAKPAVEAWCRERGDLLGLTGAA
jgi:predicted acylesterase/phospholipase RssA/CRP-like cAMP-binding protein